MKGSNMDTLQIINLVLDILIVVFAGIATYRNTKLINRLNAELDAVWDTFEDIDGIIHHLRGMIYNLREETRKGKK